MLKYLWSGRSTCFYLVLRVSISNSCQDVADLPCGATVTPYSTQTSWTEREWGVWGRAPVTPDPLTNVCLQYVFVFSRTFILQSWNCFALPSGAMRQPASTEVGNSVNAWLHNLCFLCRATESLQKCWQNLQCLSLRHCCLPSLQGQASVSWKSHFSPPFFSDLHLDPGDLGKALLSLYFIILKLFCFGGDICFKILLTYCFLKHVTEAALCKKSLIWLSVFQASVSVFVFWPWDSIWI